MFVLQIKMPRTVENLYDSCLYNDQGALSNGTIADYGFMNCVTASEKTKLFEMYQDLIFNHLLRTFKSRDKFFKELHTQCIQGNLLNFIQEVYQKNNDIQSTYYQWITAHPHIVKNYYPL